MKIQHFLKFILLLTIIVLFSSVANLAQDFPDVCQQPENILRNCNFDGGLDHWQTFTEAGGANISVLQGGGECHAPLCPAAHIVTEDHFVGGLYQQVPVVKGNSYYANIVWLVFDSLVNDGAVYQATGGIGRRIGLDPFGGTDSRSANVVWSQDNWRNDCKICNVEQVTVTAQADMITIFLRIDDTWKLRAAEKGFSIPPTKDQFWIDDLGLKQVGEAVVALESPVETPPPPTNTPPPPTDTPIPEIPTDTPPEDTSTSESEAVAEEVELTEEPVEVASPSATATAANTSTPTPAPPPTLTPTTVPSLTPTFVRRQRSTPAALAPQQVRTAPEATPVELSGMMGAVGATVCLGGGGLLVIASVMGGLVWLYRLGWGERKEEEEEDNEDEDV